MFNMLKSLMAPPSKVSPYDNGSEAFRKGTELEDNPYPKNDDKDDLRWYYWRQGWGRARIDAIVAEKGTCAGDHVGNDLNGCVCDINGVGWKSLGRYTSQCKICGEVWELDWGGWTHQVDEEKARNPELGHSFRDDGVACTKCGARFRAAAEPCINREGDEDITEWLSARDSLKAAKAGLTDAERKLEKAALQLSARPCPRCHGSGGDACRMCRGEGAIGRQNDDYRTVEQLGLEKNE